jgi:NAD(P)H-hydrate epimerase
MDVPVAVGPSNVPANGAVVDALVGYSLSGPLRGTAAEIVDQVAADSTVVSLDVPTGRDATTGEPPGIAVDPDCVVTLALPKTGLAGLDCSLWLADIAIPTVVYDRLDIAADRVFSGDYLIELVERNRQE